jgi:hypothetical protein
MRKVKIALLIVFSLTLTALPLGILSVYGASIKLPEYVPYDAGPEIRAKTSAPILGFLDKPTSEEGLKTSDIGDEKVWLLNDDIYGLYLEIYYLYAELDNVEIWVQEDYGWLPGDPREDPIITTDMVNWLANEFNDTIHPTDTGYFGQEYYHDGTNAILDDILRTIPGYEWVPDDYYASEKTAILVSNIRDASFYDYTFPSFIIGFYWSLFEEYFDRNIISLDAAYWQNLLGPAGSEWVPGVFVEEEDAYVYESTTAHEFQHLIHDDWLAGDEDYMNEACSMFAEALCGYPIDPGQIEWFLATPDNSLTEWGDQGGYNILADYGAAYLWTLYLTDHYGFDFMSKYVQESGLPLSSIPRITELLPEGTSFYDVYHDWRIANLLDADGLYGYDSIDLSELYPLKVHEIPHKKIPWTGSEMLGFTYTHPTQYAPKGYKLDEFRLGPFGTDYIALTGLEGENYLLFDGHDLTHYDYGWKHIDHVWESGGGDLINILLAGEAHVDPDDPELEITTYWDIEDYWDFGFVQISTDNGETWTSLFNEWMTYDYDPNCHNKIRDYLPGLTGWTVYYGVPYVTMTFDLTDYADQDVLVGFRFMTDWGTTYEGWKIYDDVLVSGVPVELENIPYEADFMVTLVAMTGSEYEVFDLSLDDLTEFGFSLIDSADFDELILIISPTSEYGVTDYDFRTLKLK